MTTFTFEHLKNIYLEYKSRYPNNPYNHISELLEEAKLKHQNCFNGEDHGQSWRAFKGKNTEKLILFIIEEYIESKNINLKIINGNSLERQSSEHLNKEKGSVKRNLLIDYGKFGFHLPDIDMIIYNPKTYKILAVLSSKTSLRERIAQTGYWKIKMSLDKITKHIKTFFITLDQDQTLKTKEPAKKGRAIVERDLDCTYILTEEPFETSDKVKPFSDFFKDLEKLQQ